MSTATARETTGLGRSQGLPPLESGDRLSRAEFERRYEAMPELKKAELIEGVVFLGSPVRAELHSRPNAEILGWLGNYYARTPGVMAAAHATVRLDQDNEFQPDAALLIDPARGGRASISQDDYLEGPPELVVEVAASSTGIDLHSNMNVYRRNGVPEYIVWRVRDRQIDWFTLNEGQYTRREPDPDGLHRSTKFPGLWLDPAALLAGNLALVLDVLARGVASPEHADFIARLGG